LSIIARHPAERAGGNGSFIERQNAEMATLEIFLFYVEKIEKYKQN